MCVYSAYVTEVQKQWPGLQQPYMPSQFPMMSPTTDPRILQEILDIGKRLDRIDKALGLKDCTQEAAAKKAFEDRLTKLIVDATALKTSVECKVNAQQSASTAAQVLAGASIGYQSSAPNASSGSSGITVGNWAAGYAKISE